VKVAGAVDGEHKNKILVADVLSEFLNLGGAYTSLKPNFQQVLLDEAVPLHSVLMKAYSESLILPYEDLQRHLTYSTSLHRSFQLPTLFLKEFRKDSQYSEQWSDLNLINLFLSAARPYNQYNLVENSEHFTLVSSFERGLTTEEIRYLRDTFGKSIDYSKVKITRGNIAASPYGIGSHTAANTINLADNWNGPVFQVDGTSLTENGLILLSHEITHVWQWQNGDYSYATGATMANLHAILTTGNRNNAYKWDDAHNQKIAWENWNPEQQAAAMQKFNETIQIIYKGARGKELDEANHYLRILNPYVLKVLNKQGAPKEKSFGLGNYSG
jgi:hypothetical protein